MAARIGSGGPGAQLSTVGVPVDNRRDMARELMATALIAQLSAVEGLLQQIVVTGERHTDNKAKREAAAARTPTSGEVQRALQNIQREHGVVVTGRFDGPTTALLQRLGLVPQAPTPTPAPTSTPAPPKTTAPPPSPPTTTPERKPLDPAARQQTRAAVEARDAQAKTLRTAMGFSVPSSSSSSSSFASSSSSSKPLDRALDPARLLASLVAGGVSAQQPPQALSSFQAVVGLPPTGQLDARTVQALVATGLVSAEAAAAHSSSSASSSSTSSSAASAASSTTSSSSATTTRAVKETTSTTTGSGASTSAATTRAQPSTSPEAAREQARLESLLAQAAATERGVEATTGDPAALIGHGEQPGTTTGITGSGGSHGGADSGGDESAAIVDDGATGAESSTGNQHGGDDDHTDTDRGDAVAAAGEDDDLDGDVPDGHHRVPKLSTQIDAALADIHRLDDDVPVHYTWDVTLYRPGVYTDGQPAEAVWHLVVERAHAFDAVWAQAAMAIAVRLLAIEPDASPPALDDLLGALRRARVR